MTPETAREDGLFDAQYADVLGVPFDFTAKPTVASPQPPREMIQVKAVRPERDALGIRFPRVDSRRVELPQERLTARFNLGLEVPYRHGSESRRYVPDFIVLVDDGHGEADLLHRCIVIL